MGRGRGAAMGAQPLEFVDSAIQEAIVSQRNTEPAAARSRFFDAAEGNDTLGNLFEECADGAEQLEIADEDVKIMPQHEEVESARDMLLAAFAKAK